MSFRNADLFHVCVVIVNWLQNMADRADVARNICAATSGHGHGGRKHIATIRRCELNLCANFDSTLRTHGLNGRQTKPTDFASLHLAGGLHLTSCMSSSTNTGRKRRILFVEDDPVHSRVVGKWLTSAGYEILAVYSFAEAIAALKDRWDAVVSDCDLPDGSGLEIARIAKLAYPRLPFILVTAGQTVERVVLAVRYGIDDLMLKMAPMRREVLLARLAELIEATNEPYETVLAIGAHPDDVEIGCGGALLQHVQNGHRVIILTMSHGAESEGEEIRSQEAHAAATLLGAELILARLPYANLDEAGESIKLIQQTIEAYQPTRVYTHSVNDVHQDHRNVARATLSATRDIPRVACYQASSATVDFRPTMFIDIHRQLELKLQLIKTYQSQSLKEAYLAPEQIRANARYWSKYTASEGAEPFEVIRSCA